MSNGAGARHPEWDECPTDLADIDGGVEGAANVHAEVRSQQVPVASQRVQLHLAHRRAVAEVIEWLLPAKACRAPEVISAPSGFQTHR